jgi:hypothetical protein
LISLLLVLLLQLLLLLLLLLLPSARSTQCQSSMLIAPSFMRTNTS